MWLNKMSFKKMKKITTLNKTCALISLSIEFFSVQEINKNSGKMLGFNLTNAVTNV